MTSKVGIGLLEGEKLLFEVGDLGAEGIGARLVVCVGPMYSQ